MPQPGELITILVLKRDLALIRNFGHLRMITPGPTWCEVSVTAETFAEIQRRQIRYLQ